MRAVVRRKPGFAFRSARAPAEAIIPFAHTTSAAFVPRSGSAKGRTFVRYRTKVLEGVRKPHFLTCDIVLPAGPLARIRYGK